MSNTVALTVLNRWLAQADRALATERLIDQEIARGEYPGAERERRPRTRAEAEEVDWQLREEVAA